MPRKKPVQSVKERLRVRDLDTLDVAASLFDKQRVGIFPRDAGDRSHFRRLERLGLLVFDAWGRDMDREIERDVPIYSLTETGRKALKDYDWPASRKERYYR